MRLAVGFLTLLAGLLATASAAQDGADDCDMLPPRVHAEAPYSGWSERDLCAAGQDPLWEGLPEDLTWVMRFAFTAGHAELSRYVTITERPGGTGFMEVGGRDTPYRGQHTRLDRRRFALDPETLAHLHELAEASGTFEHEIGTWDRQDGETIYLHCQLLEMERADAQGYRYSSVNIGCNHPARLMPLVEEVVRLAGLETIDGGRLYR